MTAIHTLSVVIGVALKGNFDATMTTHPSSIELVKLSSNWSLKVRQSANSNNYNAILYLPNSLGWKLKAMLNFLHCRWQPLLIQAKPNLNDLKLQHLRLNPPIFKNVKFFIILKMKFENRPRYPRPHCLANQIRLFH